MVIYEIKRQPEKPNPVFQAAYWVCDILPTKHTSVKVAVLGVALRKALFTILETKNSHT